MLPFVVVAIVIVAGYLAASYFGTIQSANAQVNYGRIGQTVTEQITENAGRSSLDQAGGQPLEGAPEGAPSAGGAEGVVLGGPGSFPPVGETAEPANEGAPPVTYDISPGSQYYTSSEDIGGQRVQDLAPATLRALVAQIPLVTSQPDENYRQLIIATLVPILERFQVMVRAPAQAGSFPVGKGPWDSGSRRYSPFDIVGGGGPPPGRSTPVPPFPPLQQEGGGQKAEGPTAADVASALKLVGVLGQPGNYTAILTGAGVEKRLAIGDEVGKIGDVVFIVTDISMSSVRIANQARPNDQGLIQFVSRQGIADISLSY